MRKKSLMFLKLLLLLLCCGLSLSIVQRQAASSLSGWTIKVLPGYQHERLRGIDSEPGEITKKDGLKIEYDIGMMAGEIVKPSDVSLYLWYKEQTLNGQSVRIAFTKQRVLKATFPDSDANFWCEIRGEEDLADALLMILSYQSTVKDPK